MANVPLVCCLSMWYVVIVTKSVGLYARLWYRAGLCHMVRALLFSYLTLVYHAHCLIWIFGLKSDIMILTQSSRNWKTSTFFGKHQSAVLIHHWIDVHIPLYSRLLNSCLNVLCIGILIEILVHYLNLFSWSKDNLFGVSRFLSLYRYSSNYNKTRL